jgi:hypothetical protein
MLTVTMHSVRYSSVKFAVSPPQLSVWCRCSRWHCRVMLHAAGDCVTCLNARRNLRYQATRCIGYCISNRLMRPVYYGQQNPCTVNSCGADFENGDVKGPVAVLVFVTITIAVTFNRRGRLALVGHGGHYALESTHVCVTLFRFVLMPE